MRVSVIRQSDGRSQFLSELELEASQLPRKDDYLHIDNGVDAWGVVVHHVIWKYDESRLSKVEIIVL